MNKLKLATVVGTRPELIKMSEMIKTFDRVFDHVLIHTGQNYDYELNKVFFDDLDLKEPDYYLNVVGDTLGETVGSIISKSYSLFSEIKPDAVVVLGDTNSCLCVIAAKRLKIPIFHLEAGNRCFDENLPEEVNRRIVDTTSDVNLCYSEHARRNLLAMAADPARTFVVGSPMREVLARNAEKIATSTVLSDLSLQRKKYILLSAHREENIDNDKKFHSMVEAINCMADYFEMPVLYSLHPRSRKRIANEGIEFHPLVSMHKPFGFTDYISLQKNAYCVVSDSGTLAEESAILSFPAVSLRTSTERPEVVDKGTFILGCPDAHSLIQAIKTETELAISASPVPDYADCDTSAKVARIIQGYTPFVNATVWRKQ
ncbi:UDP-N-acetylglucosamine 2-epimerase (non-hydrolyzing) [Adlercreutzia sp. R25]|uniref:non-hydrolyzing UDP-N-acetylglucosamine 2-epimerase n=1 Tax=Adlercreutzia shanghongiae TaxID=3111773 RepID=UPI002DB93E94|nr:UDP-N-acetylglucosamine 2-epimerase (non-hydrolyzing) [Adlercreutzia sp. R25]MEC4273871.1 UDP-N-acetylglucosamine 2-epimerase (non-hydrolyzing) [Adlercreutzia sp. R25]